MVSMIERQNLSTHLMQLKMASDMLVAAKSFDERVSVDSGNFTSSVMTHALLNSNGIRVNETISSFSWSLWVWQLMVKKFLTLIFNLVLLTMLKILMYCQQAGNLLSSCKFIWIKKNREF